MASVANSWRNFPASSAAKKKIRAPSKVDFLKAQWKFCYQCLRAWVLRIIIFLWFAQIWENKRRNLIFKKFGPFSTLFVQNRPKFGHSFFPSLYILFGPFRVMWPNNQPVGNTEYGLFEQVVNGGRSTATAAASWCLSTGFVASLPNKIKYKSCCLDPDCSTGRAKVHDWKSWMFSLRGWTFYAPWP